MAENTPVGQILADLAEQMKEWQHRIVVEDGRVMDVKEIHTVGIKTDDPAIVLRIT
jgi:hypothetical protein